MTPIVPAADLIMQQQELETEMTMMGIETFRKKTKGAVEKGVEDRTPYEPTMLDHMLPKVAAWCPFNQSKAASSWPTNALPLVVKNSNFARRSSGLSTHSTSPRPGLPRR